MLKECYFINSVFNRGIDFNFLIDFHFLIPLIFSVYNLFSSYKYQQKALVG